MQDILGRLKSTNRWVLIGAAVVLIAIIALIAASASGAQQAAQAKPETAKAFAGDLTGTIVASGQLVAKKDVNLAMGTPGIVKKVSVAVGDTVRTGDLLVQLDDDITHNNLDKASLAVQAAQVKVDSSKHDLDNKVGWTPNQNQLNAATAILANSEAAVSLGQFDPAVSGPSASHQQLQQGQG
jgi:multidrug efflux pump subunit AcrA (membrane-fusion protein)